MPSKKVAWIEGEAKAEEIISALADEITTAVLPDALVNRWQKTYSTGPDKWVTYQEKFRPNVSGVYIHTDGRSYPVYAVEDNTQLQSSVTSTPLVDADGFVHETAGTTNIETGKKFKVTTVTYTKAGATVTANMADLLLVRLLTYDDAGFVISSKVSIVEQIRKTLTNTDAPDENWNEFQMAADLPVEAGDWDYLLEKGPGASVSVYAEYTSGNGYVFTRTVFAKSYTFSERYYTADPTNFIESTEVLKCTPDVPTGQTAQDYYVMLRQPSGQYNYIDIYYGTGFTGVSSTGDAAETYIRACNLTTVIPGSAPTIINQKEAEAAFIRLRDQVSGSYKPATLSWALDIDGKTSILSPPTHFFYGADSVVPWLANKKRRPDYWVAYYISVNNDRVSIVLEGDPAPDMDGYYRSFAYIGQTVPFNTQDYPGNFGVTVGMGDLDVKKTGMVINDIKQDTSPKYAGFGRYTSNGMYSFSMLRTRSNVLFQAYYPAFMTQLPNYPSVGTIPSQLSKLIVESNGFQPSNWTDRYHASPIYLVHQYEGYRSYMESVVAVNDHNLVNLDELVVDTEEWKDPADHTQGTWTEVYKFFSLKSPVNFFAYSANPADMTIAILKEVK